MNAGDLSQLARSGKHFVALNDDTMLKMHALRRFLCLLPRSDYQQNVSAGAAANGESANKDDERDASLIPCFDDDKLIATMFQMMTGGLVPHVVWDKDQAVEASFNTVVGGGNVGEDEDTRIPRELFRLPPADGGAAAMRYLAYETVIARGHSRRSLAIMKNPLLPVSIHRAVIKIVSLPHITEEGLLEYNSPSPRRDQSPRDKAHANLRGTNKLLTPQCCFGIYAPSLKIEGDVHLTNTYSSPRWAAVYWGDGKTTPQQPSMGYVTAAGQPVSQAFNELRFCEGDTLAVEVEECGDERHSVAKARWSRNGVQFSEVVLSRQYPALRVPLSECYLGVQLSHGAEVALVGTDVGKLVSM